MASLLMGEVLLVTSIGDVLGKLFVAIMPGYAALTNHTYDWLERAMRFFLTQFERYAKGEPLLNVVDKQRGY